MIKITEGTKPVMNDPDVVAHVAEVLKAAFGDKFRFRRRGRASEDFSEFTGAGVPSMMFNIGVYEPGTYRRSTQRRRPANTVQSFAAVRAGAEADHRNRHHRDDARGSRCLRSEGPAQ